MLPYLFSQAVARPHEIDQNSEILFIANNPLCIHHTFAPAPLPSTCSVDNPVPANPLESRFPLLNLLLGPANRQPDMARLGLGL